MTVFFDLDRTLLDFETAENCGIRAVFEAYSAEIKMEYDEFQSEWKKWAQRFFDQYSAGKLSFSRQRMMRVAKIFELNGAPVDESELESRFAVYLASYENAFGLFDDVIPVLEKLRQSSFRLALITNGDSVNQRAKLEKAGITGFFNPIVISSEAGASKPDLRIFQEALQRAHGSAGDSWYVGDSMEHDIIPARKIGMNALYLNRNRNGRLNIEFSVEGTAYAEIKSLHEIFEVLAKKNRDSGEKNEEKII
ncbi:MAG: HAD family hydrolase [Treponema sp.]|nr:HAD family hydrolase [Treponema sp.]